MFPFRRLHPLMALAVTVLAAGAASAASEIFDKKVDPNNGFLAVTDATYRAECGTCHFAYSPGLLPERSWKWVMSGLDKHYGENVKISPQASASISKYLADNAADKSKFEGSKQIMVRISDSMTPRRVINVPHISTMHRVMKEVLGTNSKVEVRKFTNCNGCHQQAEKGSFAYDELVIPGLDQSWGYTIQKP